MSPESSKRPPAAATNNKQGRRDLFYEKGVADLISLDATSDERRKGVELIRFAIKNYEEAARTGVYDARGVLTSKKIKTGAYWRREKNQWRRIKTYNRKNPPGRPRKDAIRLLVANLALAYLRITGKVPSRNWDDVFLTDFEKFVQPVFGAMGLGDPLGWVRKHVETRDAEGEDEGGPSKSF
jgi:hypothetical protein